MFSPVVFIQRVFLLIVAQLCLMKIYTEKRYIKCVCHHSTWLFSWFHMVIAQLSLNWNRCKKWKVCFSRDEFVDSEIWEIFTSLPPKNSYGKTNRFSVCIKWTLSITLLFKRLCLCRSRRRHHPQPNSS